MRETYYSSTVIIESRAQQPLCDWSIPRKGTGAVLRSPKLGTKFACSCACAHAMMMLLPSAL